jgi:hypothetical protein
MDTRQWTTKKIMNTSEYNGNSEDNGHHRRKWTPAKIMDTSEDNGHQRG